MLNQRPIFIHAFGRGGSNIFMNLLLSHPDVCMSSGETSRVFKGARYDSRLRRLKKRLFFDLPIRLVTGQNYFEAGCLEPRAAVPVLLQKYIDRILYHGRFTFMGEMHNRYRHEGVPYTREELAKCRLLTKGGGGIVFTVDLFREMYPDASFLALVRNGLALCESHVRRGTSARHIAQTYKSAAGKMLESSRQMPNYRIFRYEEMVRDPVEFMKQAYEFAGLDIGQVRKVRLQSKKVMGQDGKRDYLRAGYDRQVFWHDLSDLRLHIRQDANENQIRQLKPEDREIFLSIAGDVMQELGYADS